MNVLMIGDIVSPDAVAYLVERLPGLRRDFDVDLVIANAENCAITAPTPWKGSGMRVELVECLLDGGVDVITSGTTAGTARRWRPSTGIPGCYGRTTFLRRLWEKVS